MSTDQVHESIPFFERSNKFFGNNTEVLRNLGYCYCLVWNYSKGIAILKRAHHLSPSDAFITEDLAMSLIASGEVLEWNVLLRQLEKSLEK
jgi:Flp pilus assembly protein TadD